MFADRITFHENFYIRSTIHAHCYTNQMHKSYLSAYYSEVIEHPN